MSTPTEDAIAALRELIRQVEISGAFDDHGHALTNLKALADGKAALARLTAEQAKVPPDREKLIDQCIEWAYLLPAGWEKKLLLDCAVALRRPATAECEEMAKRLEIAEHPQSGAGRLMREAAALIRRLAPADGWRPISEAPEDTPILLWHGAQKYQQVGLFVSARQRWEDHGTGSALYADINYWMPLPSPPAEENAR